MKAREFLKYVAGLSFIGVLFAGSLTYGEFFPAGTVCVTCSQSLLFGLPVCLYGLAMYTAIFLLSAYGYYRGK